MQRCNNRYENSDCGRSTGVNRDLPAPKATQIIDSGAGIADISQDRLSTAQEQPTRLGQGDSIRIAIKQVNTEEVFE